jgi:hypothetical protein
MAVARGAALMSAVAAAAAAAAPGIGWAYDASQVVDALHPYGSTGIVEYEVGVDSGLEGVNLQGRVKV